MIKILCTWINFQLWRADLAAAKKRADYLHKHLNRRYWVVQIDKKMFVLSRENIDRLKREGVLRSDLDFIKLNKIALYTTN